MQDIKITWYSYQSSTKGETIVEAYSLTDAIDMVRFDQSYNVIILKAEYCDIDKLINSL